MKDTVYLTSSIKLSVSGDFQKNIEAYIKCIGYADIMRKATALTKKRYDLKLESLKEDLNSKTLSKECYDSEVKVYTEGFSSDLAKASALAKLLPQMQFTEAFQELEITNSEKLKEYLGCSKATSDWILAHMPKCKDASASNRMNNNKFIDSVNLKAWYKRLLNIGAEKLYMQYGIDNVKDRAFNYKSLMTYNEKKKVYEVKPLNITISKVCDSLGIQESTL